MKYNLKHKIKEIVLGNYSKATLETQTPKLVDSATKSIRSCRGRHRPRSQTDALAVTSLDIDGVKVGWCPQIKNSVANSYRSGSLGGKLAMNHRELP